MSICLFFYSPSEVEKKAALVFVIKSYFWIGQQMYKLNFNWQVNIKMYLPIQVFVHVKDV